MSTISGLATHSVQVRFKFQLGEWVLADWRPLLIPVKSSGSDDAIWREPSGGQPADLPGGCVGYLLRGTPISDFSRGLARRGPWLCYSPRQERLYVVEIDGGFDDYLKRRSPKSRQNLKRAVKRFLERSPQALEVVTSTEGMAAFHREAVAISRETYQTQLLGAGLPDTEAFLQAMRDKAGRGDARGYLLREQGQAIAFAWCAARGDSLVYEVIGYRPDRADQSPGTVLLYLILEDLFSLGRYKLLDFGSGHAFYKESFATRFTDFADVYLLRASWKHRLLLQLHWRVERFSEDMGAFLEQLGLKRYVRAAVRRLHRIRGEA